MNIMVESRSVLQGKGCQRLAVLPESREKVLDRCHHRHQKDPDFQTSLIWIMRKYISATQAVLLGTVF